MKSVSKKIASRQLRKAEEFFVKVSEEVQNV